MIAADLERRVLELLRQQYEDEGYEFRVRPEAESLPDFMEDYVPDAIAVKGQMGVAIEVKGRRMLSTERRLREVGKRFRDQRDWQLRVVYADEFETGLPGTSGEPEIRIDLGSAENLLGMNETRAALVMAWSALEAAVRLIARRTGEKPPRNAREAIEALEHLGILPFESADELRRNYGLRSQVVHGEFGMPVTADAVLPVLQAARQTLEFNAAEVRH